MRVPKVADNNSAVVVPAYNEAATIRDVVQRCLAQVSLVIVVDDGSRDGTAALLEGLPVVLLRHPVNRGKGASLVTGFREALKHDIHAVITLDGDGQHRPEDIPSFLAQAREAGSMIIIGSRRAGKVNQPRLNYTLNRIADFWISWASGYLIEDSQCGFRLFPRDILERVEAKHARRHSFVFESEILINAARAGFRSCPVSIPTLYNSVTRRRSHFRPIDVAWIVLMVASKLLPRWMYPQGLFQCFRDFRQARLVARR